MPRTCLPRTAAIHGGTKGEETEAVMARVVERGEVVTVFGVVTDFVAAKDSAVVKVSEADFPAVVDFREVDSLAEVDSPVVEAFPAAA